MAWTAIPTVTTATGITSAWGQAITANLNLFNAAWTSYTPTVAGFTTVTTSTTGAFLQVGKSVLFRAQVSLAVVTTLGAAQITVSLPATASSSIPTGSNAGVLGFARYRNNAGTVLFLGEAFLQTTTTLGIRVPVSTAASNIGTWTGAAPGSQVSGDTWTISGFYESA